MICMQLHSPTLQYNETTNSNLKQFAYGNCKLEVICGLSLAMCRFPLHVSCSQHLQSPWL